MSLPHKVWLWYDLHSVHNYCHFLIPSKMFLLWFIFGFTSMCIISLFSHFFFIIVICFIQLYMISLWLGIFQTSVLPDVLSFLQHNWDWCNLGTMDKYTKFPPVTVRHYTEHLIFINWSGCLPLCVRTVKCGTEIRTHLHCLWTHLCAFRMRRLWMICIHTWTVPVSLIWTFPLCRCDVLILLFVLNVWKSINVTKSQCV